MNKQMREITKLCKRHGCTVEPTPRHHKIYKEGRLITAASCSPKDRHNALRQLERDLKRYA